MSNDIKSELNQKLEDIQNRIESVRLEAIGLSGELYSQHPPASPRCTPNFFNQAASLEKPNRDSQSPVDVASRRFSRLSAEISRFIADDNAPPQEGTQLLEESLTAIKEIEQAISDLSHSLPSSDSTRSLAAIALNLDSSRDNTPRQLA